MCLSRSGNLFFICYLLAVLPLSHTVQAQEQSAPSPMLTLPSSSDSTTLPSNSLDMIWQKLLDEWAKFGPIWSELMKAQERLGIGIDELPTYLTNMEKRLDDLNALWQAETQARLQIEKSRDSYRIAFWIGVPVSILMGGGIVLWILK